jgi:hypothetical protein
VGRALGTFFKKSPKNVTKLQVLDCLLSIKMLSILSNIEFFEKIRKKFDYTIYTFLTIVFGSKRPLLRYNMTMNERIFH